ncbi:nuclear transport factor 2 family protein [Parahaliea aestuarii]|uniref:Nuclear transport factor 2 family protein n=1 Tax=Parahaliea aestuarii TaxID=1852021 RepID=A0A5C8ZV88_9GAMM|nr:nuclear transport factor 2 family protein [Parahaliea aestuarii]TXS91492.1 nuclear transport factor 2 family protein [Parahaliea aestuarii]
MQKWLALLLLVALNAHAAPRDDIASVLDSFHTAAARADLPAYRQLMTADMVFLGTDATERWQGEEFIEFARPYFDRGKGWIYRPKERRIDIAASGDVAWFDELLDNDKLGLCRGSGLLLKTGSGWKIAQYNLSMPVPNAMIESVAQAIRTETPVSAVAEESDLGAAEDGGEHSSGEAQPRCRKRHKTNRAADC